MFDCKKQIVTATTITPSGETFRGENGIQNKQIGCPRDIAGMKSGEGYHLCKSICGQISHAEIAAIKAAGDKAEGSTLYLEGHSYACEPCKKACRDAGIIEIVIGNPPQ